MKSAPLPEITLTCRDGHRFPTRARGGQPVKCPTCRASVWVPTHRPAGEVAAGSDDSDAGELEQRWTLERTMPAGELEPAGSDCPECGTALVWEPGRTLLLCEQCGTSHLPAGIVRRYAELEVRQQGPTQLERAQSRIAEVKTRMEFSQQKDAAVRRLRKLADFLDPDELPEESHLEDLAVNLHSNVNHLIGEIRHAQTDDEFAALNAVTNELFDTIRIYVSQFRDEHTRAQQEAEEDEEDDDSEDYEYAEVVEPARDWQAPRYPKATPQSIARQQYRAQLPAAGPAANFPALVRTVVPPPFVPTCGFSHLFRPVAKLKIYPTQWEGGPAVPGEKPVYCCEKHRDDALNFTWSKGHRAAAIDEVERARV